MIKSKYFIALLPLLIAVAIHLVGLYLDSMESCTIFSKLIKPCLVSGVDLSWFGTIATFNLALGWGAGIWSIFRIGRLLGQDLPPPWGSHDERPNS